MKRIVIVYSPRSARFDEVQRKVIEKSRSLKGWMVLKFEVPEAPVYSNARKLAGIIRKDDLVLSAGGDGTASMCLNAIMMSGKQAALAAMPFGNFNDYAETFGRMSLERIVRRFEEGRYSDYYPMEIKVDGQHYVYSGMYFTIGLMAEAERVFKNPKVRRKLARARSRMRFSARKLFSWYVKNKRRKDFLPFNMKINGECVPKLTTDYVAINGKNMAGVVPARGWFLEPEMFWSGTMKSRSLFRMFSKFLRALEGRLPGGETKGDEIVFPSKADVYVHSEGEGEKLTGIAKIEVSKNGKALRVIRS